MWLHAIPVALAHRMSVRVRLGEGGPELVVSAQLRDTAEGPVIRLCLDDPDRAFRFTPAPRPSPDPARNN